MRKYRTSVVLGVLGAVSLLVSTLTVVPEVWAMLATVGGAIFAAGFLVVTLSVRARSG